jgi:hypothetical protein
LANTTPILPTKDGSGIKVANVKNSIKNADMIDNIFVAMVDPLFYKLLNFTLKF